MKKLKVMVVNSTTLKLEEKGEVGDLIDITELQTIDQTPIIKALKEGTDAIYRTHLATFKRELELQHELSIKQKEEVFSKEKNELVQKNALLNQKIESLPSEIEKEKARIKLEIEKGFSKDLNLLNNEKEMLLRDIQQIKTTARLEKEAEIAQVNAANNLQLSALNGTLERLKLELELKHNKELEQLSEQVRAKDKEIDGLKRERTASVKKIGENLERWCLEQYQTHSLSGFSTSTFEKDNTAIKGAGDSSGTKGDYVFKVFSPKDATLVVTSAMCEMKSEGVESENKKKNKDHFAKLHTDRLKKGCEYALLVSELEYENESFAPIYRVNDPAYPKMYVVRPDYFIIFLSIIESIGLKNDELLSEKRLDDIRFAEKKEIIRIYEDFKQDLLDTQFHHMETKLRDINVKTATIISSAESIKESVRIITDSHLSAIANKINQFSIHSLIRKIDKVE